MTDQFDSDKTDQFSSDKTHEVDLHFLLLTVEADVRICRETTTVLIDNC